MTCRRALLGEVGERVAGRPLVHADLGQPRDGCLRLQSLQVAHKGAQGTAELDRPAGCVTVPEGQLPRNAGRRGDEHAVVRDVVDAPARAAESEHVADARLVDHLLVELTDPRRALARVSTREEDAEKSAVGNRAAARDSEPLGTGTGRELPGDAVP